MNCADRVTIVGLRGDVKYNGMTGILQEYDEEDGCWSVSVLGEEVRVRTENISTSFVDAKKELYVKLRVDSIKMPTLYAVDNGFYNGFSVNKKIEILLKLAKKEKRPEFAHFFYKFPTLRQLQQLGAHEIVTPMRFSVSDHVLQRAIRFIEANPSHMRVIHFVVQGGAFHHAMNEAEFESVMNHQRKAG